jgi:hypothetical protein
MEEKDRQRTFKESNMRDQNKSCDILPKGRQGFKGGQIT